MNNWVNIERLSTKFYYFVLDRTKFITLLGANLSIVYFFRIIRATVENLSIFFAVRYNIMYITAFARRTLLSVVKPS